MQVDAAWDAKRTQEETLLTGFMSSLEGQLLECATRLRSASDSISSSQGTHLFAFIDTLIPFHLPNPM